MRAGLHRESGGKNNHLWHARCVKMRQLHTTQSLLSNLTHAAEPTCRLRLQQLPSHVLQALNLHACCIKQRRVCPLLRWLLGGAAALLCLHASVLHLCCS